MLCHPVCSAKLRFDNCAERGFFFGGGVFFSSFFFRTKDNYDTYIAKEKYSCVVFCASLLQTVVVGHFDFNSSPQPPGFQQFYYAAMRVVEHGM